MSNFPYNNDEYNHGALVNGSPVNFATAENWAGIVMNWHARNNTSDWTQSNDGHDTAVRHLAWALIELLSDPNAIHRLITTGKGVEESVRTMLELSVINKSNPLSFFPDDVWLALLKVIPELESMSTRRANPLP